MKIEGSYTFKDAPREVVWETLMDPDALSTALPGGDKLVKIDENEYEAALDVRVGPVQGNFEGKIEVSDLQPPETYHMKVSGQGASGFLNGEGDVTLEESGSDTLMHYAGEAQVGGRIAGVGQRLISSSARSIIRQGLEALDLQVQARTAARAAAPAAAPAAIDSTSIQSEEVIMTERSEPVEPVRTAGDTVIVSDTASDTSDKEPEVIMMGAESGRVTVEPEGSVVVVDQNVKTVEPAPIATPSSQGPSSTQMAARVARDVTSDVANDTLKTLMSPQYQMYTMIGVAIILTLFFALLANFLVAIF